MWIDAWFLRALSLKNARPHSLHSNVLEPKRKIKQNEMVFCWKPNGIEIEFLWGNPKQRSKQLFYHKILYWLRMRPIKLLFSRDYNWVIILLTPAYDKLPTFTWMCSLVYEQIGPCRVTLFTFITLIFFAEMLITANRMLFHLMCLQSSAITIGFLTDNARCLFSFVDFGSYICIIFVKIQSFFKGTIKVDQH